MDAVKGRLKSIALKHIASVPIFFKKNNEGCKKPFTALQLVKELEKYVIDSRQLSVSLKLLSSRN